MASPIFSMFANSPFKPIQAHMKKVNDCTVMLEEFIIATNKEDWENAESVQAQICKLEEDADILKRELRLNLPDGLFMPVPRTDLLDLLGKQDRIANKSKDIAGLMLGRKMTIPAPIKDSVLEFVQCSIQTTTKAYKVIQELDELVETGFRGHEVKKVEQLIFDLDDAEDQADNHERDVRAQLFAIESEYNPIEVIFLYRVIDWIGEVANRAQEVGHRLHLMLAR